MAFHQSSIYIKDDLFNKLINAVDTTNIKRSRLIETLLIRYLERNCYKKITCETQKYQKINKDTECRRICIFWRDEIYEQTFDLRKVFRKSISYLIAHAIEKYLDEIIKEILNNGKTNNYEFFIGFSTTDHTHSYKSITIWGDLDPDILKNQLNL